MSAAVSWKTRIFITLLSAAAACTAHAANNPASAVVVYYSFDAAPSTATFQSMQAEMSRIFDPAAIPVQWKHLGPGGGEADGEIVVARFHGVCTTGAWSSGRAQGIAAGGFPLADSKTSNGQVLPFADVDCGALQAYLSGQRFSDPGTALGKAMARVLSHEIYHILTASTAHAHAGIARAEHSRDDLTAAAFTFGRAELDWLREWSARSRMMANSGYATAGSDDASSSETDAAAR